MTLNFCTHTARHSTTYTAAHQAYKQVTAFLLPVASSEPLRNLPSVIVGSTLGPILLLCVALVTFGTPRHKP